MTHTKTPWVVEYPMGEETPWIVEAGQETWQWRCIAVTMSGDSSDNFTEKEALANAAFIVKACNAHDALVAALEGLLSLIELMDGDGAPEKVAKDAEKQARAALGKVK